MPTLKLHLRGGTTCHLDIDDGSPIEAKFRQILQRRSVPRETLMYQDKGGLQVFFTDEILWFEVQGASPDSVKEMQRIYGEFRDGAS